MDITKDAIIAAYQRTEILPVARTWDTRAALPDGREVACGCALVALCRAAGIDPEPIITGQFRTNYQRSRAFAAALGIPLDVVKGVVHGWDDWSRAWAPSFGRDTPAGKAYLAAWDAAAAVLGPRQATTE